MRGPARHFQTVAGSCALGALLAVGTAQAQQPFYFGVDLHNWFFNPDRGSAASDVGVRAKFGARLTPQVALEAHLATGGSDRTGRGDEIDPSYLLSGLVRGDIPITRYSSLYGVVGFSELRFDVNNRSEKESSISFGLGGDFQVANNTYLNIDYIRYISDSDFDYDALNLGARWEF